MVTTVATAFGVSLFVFFTLLVIIRREQVRGRRFVAGWFRGWLDEKVNAMETGVVRSWNHFIKYILQLNWYYSIHSVLQGILRVIVAFYSYFEHHFEKNRQRTKQLRAEKRKSGSVNHLSRMAEHKEETALTATEKKKLRKDKLEERH